MVWLTENWIWALFGLAFISMHFFGHGRHGGCCGHDGHSSGSGGDADADKSTGKQDNGGTVRREPNRQ